MKEFVVIIENAGKNYSAYSPDVPGCIATGKTIDETQKHFEAALQFHLDGLRDAGLPAPQPNAVVMKVSVAA